MPWLAHRPYRDHNIVANVHIANQAATTYFGTKTQLSHPHPKPPLPTPGQNGPHFADDILRCIFVKWKFCIFIKILLKFIPMRPIDHNPAMVYLWLGAE